MNDLQKSIIIKGLFPIGTEYSEASIAKILGKLLDGEPSVLCAIHAPRLDWGWNFVACKASAMGVGLREWTLNPGFWDWSSLYNIIRGARDEAIETWDSAGVTLDLISEPLKPVNIHDDSRSLPS